MNPKSPCKVSIQRKSSRHQAGPLKVAAAGDPISEFVLLDNEDSTCTVLGVSRAGNQVDISGVATLAAVSADPSIVSIVDPIVGMTFKMFAVGPLGGPLNITATATWKDGSIGPFVFDLPVTVKAGPANSIIIVPGTPVPHVI